MLNCLVEWFVMSEIVLCMLYLSRAFGAVVEYMLCRAQQNYSKTTYLSISTRLPATHIKLQGGPGMALFSASTFQKYCQF